MKPAPNGEKETRTVRGTQGQSQYLIDPNIHREPRSEGISNRSESLGIDRDNRSSRQPTEHVTCRERITGGMLRQLINEYRDQVAIKKEEIERLESRVHELEELEKDLVEDCKE